MRNLSVITLIIVGSACSKTTDPAPVKYTSLLGTWQVDNNGVVATFDIVSDPYYAKSDTLYVTRGVVKYANNIAYDYPTQVNRVIKTNGYYTFSFATYFGVCPNCAGNGVQLYAFYPNSTMTEMTSNAGNPTDPNYFVYSSWVGVMFMNGTPEPRVVNLQPPVILKRIKGPY